VLRTVDLERFCDNFAAFSAMNESSNHQPTTAPRLCDALGLAADSYERFLTRKDAAFAQRNADAEQNVRQALLNELLWAE
jgi:hypothetical protein